MTVPLRPALRPLEIVQVGRPENGHFSLHDPEGFGETVVVGYGALVLAMLMDGQHTLAEIQAAFKRQTGVATALIELEQYVAQLEDAHLLAGERFDRYRRQQIDAYLASPVRPASFAGAAYSDDPEALRKELAGFFNSNGGPGGLDASAPLEGNRLRGIVSPHIDLQRGGVAYAWAYKQAAERSQADLFVVFGTAHSAMRELFSVSRKDFATPLGVVRTDQAFVDRLAEHLVSSLVGAQIDLFSHELTHRIEHSIEFQAVFLQYTLAQQREFRIVPVLVGSFHEFLGGPADDGGQPGESLEVQAFLAALRSAVDGHPGEVCFVAGADFAHIGQRFGDEWPVDQTRLDAVCHDDEQLLEAVCRGDAAGFFARVADHGDRNRICGLAPTFLLLEAMRPARGQVLKYGQAVEPDGSACVSFASVAFFDE